MPPLSRPWWSPGASSIGSSCSWARARWAVVELVAQGSRLLHECIDGVHQQLAELNFQTARDRRIQPRSASGPAGPMEADLVPRERVPA